MSEGEFRAIPTPSDEDQALWFFGLYGLAMLDIQLLENAISMLYLVANVDSAMTSSAKPSRELKVAVDRGWRAFQAGSAGMKLNDVKVGVKGHLPQALHEEVDGFLTGPRNRLAHTYLPEKVSEMQGQGPQQFFASAAELIEIQRTAKKLGSQVFAIALALVEARGEGPEPPDEIKGQLEHLAKVIMLKPIPAESLARVLRGDGVAQDSRSS